MSASPRMPGVPDALADPTLKRYPLRRRRVPVGAGMLSVVLPDDRAWLRAGSWAPAVVRGHEPPYWIRVWPSALAVARQLARAVDLSSFRVLDLGCGVGLPGIQASARGASVCFADREADALAFARWNAAQQPGGPREVATQQIDWAVECVSGVFDLVLLSDVSYHRSHHGPVLRQLQSVLAPDGCVLHADPMRELSQLFLRELAGPYESAQTFAAVKHDGQDVRVRLTLAARGRPALRAWTEHLRWPEVLASSMASPDS